MSRCARKANSVQTAKGLVTAKITALVIPKQAYVFVPEGGKEKNVLLPVMLAIMVVVVDRDVQKFLKEIRLAIISLVNTYVRPDTVDLHVNIPVHLEAMERIANKLVLVKMEAIVIMSQETVNVCPAGWVQTARHRVNLVDLELIVANIVNV